MADVPSDLFPDILSRLPVESLLRFRSVCQFWRHTIDDPAFVKLHLDRQSASGGHLILKNKSNGKLYSLPTNSLHFYSETSTNTSTVYASPLEETSFIVSSCNGLVLTGNIGTKAKSTELMLWNPFTRETFMLPPDAYDPRWCQYIGFGYDFVADDYKVIKFVEELKKTLVYSLKFNSWRIIDTSPVMSNPRGTYSNFKNNWNGVLFNGTLHWITKTDKKELAIVAFDLTTEECYLLPLPNQVPLLDELPSLVALGEMLLLTFRQNFVYCLDDYGGKNSWAKLFSFREIGLNEYADIIPIAYLKNRGEVLLVNNFRIKQYFLVNIENKSAKEIDLDADSSFIYPKNCLAGLVRLSHYCVNVPCNAAKTSQKTNRTNDRLQLNITTTMVEKNTNNDSSSDALVPEEDKVALIEFDLS